MSTAAAESIPTAEGSAADVASPRLRRSAALDGLRAVGVSTTVLYHLGVGAFAGGFVGIDMFFALSGYLITSIVIREHSATGTFRLGRFWLRRLLRLYPALIAVCVVAYFLWGYGVRDYAPTSSWWASALTTLTYSSNFAIWLGSVWPGPLAPMWSLAMEQQFYLVWPPILFLLLTKRVRSRFVIGGLLVIGVLSLVGVWFGFVSRGSRSTAFVYFSPLENLMPLVLGCVLALILAVPRGRALLSPRVGAWLTWIGAIGLVAIAVTMPADWKAHRYILVLILPLAGAAAAMLVAGLVTARSPISWLLGLRPIAWFGRNLSYSLYLWHYLVIIVLTQLLNGPLEKPVIVAVAVALAAASYFVIERPFLRLKDRFEPKVTERRMA
ncbi:MAG TPA: acyltransferase [Galbitalea sp.]